MDRNITIWWGRVLCLFRLRVWRVDGGCLWGGVWWSSEGGQGEGATLVYGAPAPGVFGEGKLHGDGDLNLRRFNRLIVVVSMLGTLGGCAVSFDGGTLGVKVSMSEPAGQPPEGTEFTITKKAVFLLFGLRRASSPSLESVLGGQLLDAAEIRNLQIKVRSRFADILITILTVGLIVPRSVTFHGYVVPADSGSVP